MADLCSMARQFSLIQSLRSAACLRLAFFASSSSAAARAASHERQAQTPVVPLPLADGGAYNGYGFPSHLLAFTSIVYFEGEKSEAGNNKRGYRLALGLLQF